MMNTYSGVLWSLEEESPDSEQFYIFTSDASFDVNVVSSLFMFSDFVIQTL